MLDSVVQDKIQKMLLLLVLLQMICVELLVR